jgi:hypothetical protein
VGASFSGAESGEVSGLEEASVVLVWRSVLHLALLSEYGSQWE